MIIKINVVLGRFTTFLKRGGGGKWGRRQGKDSGEGQEGWCQ